MKSLNDPGEEKGQVLIGKIVGTHALKGVLRVYSYAESESVFDPGKTISVTAPDGLRLRFTIKWSRPHKSVRLVCLEKVDRIDQALALVGSELFIESSALPALEEGTYYWRDLIGLSVIDIAAGFLGRISAIIPTGSNDVYVINSRQGKKEREILIPAIESVVLGIDLDEKIIRVDLPEGLIEDSGADDGRNGPDAD